MKSLRKKLPEVIIHSIYREEVEPINNWAKPDTINLVDSEGRSAIFHAILTNSIPILRILIENFADLEIKDTKGWYPLHYAAQSQSLEVVELLVKNGVSLEAKDEYGNTPLWRATFASEGRGDVIKLLLSYGADPNNPNNSGISPYKLAQSIANYNVRHFFE